jgi:hypothetical protein
LGLAAAVADAHDREVDGRGESERDLEDPHEARRIEATDEDTGERFAARGAGDEQRAAPGPPEPPAIPEVAEQRTAEEPADEQLGLRPKERREVHLAE